MTIGLGRSNPRCSLCCGFVLFSLVICTSLVTGQVIDQAELQRMVAEKDYPTLTDSADDQQIALQLLKLLGGNRDNIGNVYLSRTFTDKDMPVVAAFADARSVIMANSQVTDEGMRYLRTMPSFQFLAQPPAAMTDKGVEHLRNLPLLTLTLPVNATDASMECVATMKELTGLGLSINITDAGFRHVAKCKALHGISLGNSQVTDAAFEHIGENAQITTINFGTAPNITPEVVKHLRQLRQLHWLEGPRGTNDRTLELLAEVKTLTRLELSSYAGVTDEGMKYLPAHEWMHDLILGANITDAGMPYIGQLKWLGNLDLTKTQVTGAGLAFLGPIGPSKLEISDSVSDEGLAHISKFTGLEYLILNGNFTDACLPHLPKRLHQVKFAHTKITDAALNRLRRERPGLIIEVQRKDEFSKLFDQRSIDLGRGTAK
jgi:hypothetical protein